MGASLRFWWGGGGHRRRQAHEQCRQCRRPAPLARGRRTHAPRAGGMGASLRFWWGSGGSRRRQAHEQCRQCRRPAPSARRRRAYAPRAGGMGASLRFWWGGGGRRRRQAHEQGPAACGGFWGTERWGGWKRWSCTCGGGGGMMMGWNCGAWSDAALPQRGKGRCGVRRRRCLPRWGKGAAVWRAWFWLVRGEMLFMRRFALQEGLAGAPGGGEKPLCVFARILQGLADAPGARGDGGRFARGENCPLFPRPPRFRNHPAGENGGLCPHPPKGPG